MCTGTYRYTNKRVGTGCSQEAVPKIRSTTVLIPTPARLIRVGPESRNPNPIIVPTTSFSLGIVKCATIKIGFWGPQLVPFLWFGLGLGI